MINQELINFTYQLAEIASITSKKYFRLPNDEATKADNSPVTIADQEIERLIRQEIIKHFPDHGIIGEEYDNINIDADYVWIIDPIDGTSSFITGKPIFGNLIALTFKKIPIIGIVNQPITGERWVGIKNSGAWLNDKKIKTRNCTQISEAVFCSSSSYFFKAESEKVLKKISALTKYQKIGGVIYGGDCYSYACLASGFVDLIIDPQMNVFDYAALIPIIEMAGGIITDWQGNDLNLRSNVGVLACANIELHQAILKVIN